MAFKDIRLPIWIEVAGGIDGGPDFEPVVIAMQESGDELREATKSFGLSSWTINYAGLNTARWRILQDFFHVVGGRRDSWRFKDWLDYKCPSAQSAVLNLTTTTWQMQKKRVVGAYTYLQNIILPLGVTLATSGGTFTVNANSGVITRTSGSGAPTSFVCEFDKLVRFDIGKLQQSLVFKSGSASDGENLIVTIKGIPIKEIPLTSA